MKLRELFSILEEGLNKDQKRRLYSDLKNLNYDRHRWAEVFGNRYRIYLDYSGELPEDAEVQSKYQEEIENAIWKVGRKNGGSGWNTNRINYIQGIATRREYKSVPIEVALGSNADIIAKWKEDVAKNTVEHEDDVMNALSRSGCVMSPYNRESYMSGKFLRGNDVTMSIGKILSRGIKAGIVDASILHKFTTDPMRASATNPKYKKKLMVVISRHPDDIGSMSTDRKWASCMNIDTGVEKEYVPIEIAEGSIVAYLILANDLKIDDPYARLLIKPFINSNDGSVALGVQDKVYPPDAPKEFSDIVVDWADNVNASRKLTGLFKLSSRVYNDNKFKTSMTLGSNNSDTNDYIKNLSSSELQSLLNEISSVVDSDFIIPELHKKENLDGGNWLVDLGYVDDDDGVDYERAKKDGINYIDNNKDAIEWRNQALKLITDIDAYDIKQFAANIDGDYTATSELPVIVAYFVHQYADVNFSDATKLSNFIKTNIKLYKKNNIWNVK